MEKVISLKVYDCVIPSDIREISSTISNIILCLNRHLGTLEECTLFEIKVILNELILNAIKHGNKGDVTKNVRVICRITSDEYVLFQVEDEGEGYNYKCLLEKSEEIEEGCELLDLKETGRGIKIVKSLSDNLKLNIKGNKIIVLKKIIRS
jgi:serine/threonine-protein kinase RsbW